MSAWRSVALSEVAEEVTVGHVGPMASEYTAEGVPFLRSQNVVPHGFDLSDIKFISSAFHARLRKSMLRPGDVVTVRTGKPGATAVVPPDWGDANCADLVITRPGPNLDSRWLSYFINSATNGFVATQLVGAVQQHFNVASARSMVLHLPPLADQRAIAEALGALDDKIAANAKLLAVADELSRVTFESMLGAAELQPLSSLARFVNGRAFTKGASGTGRVVIRIAELNSGIGGSTVFSDIDVPGEHVARPGDILFAWSGSLTLHRWYRAEAIVNQHIFKVLPSTGVPQWLIYELIRAKLTDFKAIAANKATTMGHIQRKHLDEGVAVPSETTIAAHDRAMTALWQRALFAEQENLTLAALRDALLPGLMSGRLRVRDVEAIVGEKV